jgi:hypothetical protein
MIHLIYLIGYTAIFQVLFKTRVRLSCLLYTGSFRMKCITYRPVGLLSGIAIISIFTAIMHFVLPTAFNRKKYSLLLIFLAEKIDLRRGRLNAALSRQRNFSCKTKALNGLCSRGYLLQLCHFLDATLNYRSSHLWSDMNAD